MTLSYAAGSKEWVVSNHAMEYSAQYNALRDKLFLFQNFTKLAYAYFDTQKGVSGAALLHVSDGVSVEYDIFFRSAWGYVLPESDFFYQQSLVKGIMYFGLSKDLSWILNLFQHRDFDSGSDDSYWGGQFSGEPLTRK